MRYCPHCMRPVTGGGSCPSCGGDLNWTGQTGIDLPVGTVLNGGNGLRTYQIGAARGKGGFGITYIALETNSGRRMAVKEYFPTRCAFRGGNGVDVQAMTGQEEPFRSGMNSFLEEGKMLLSQDDLSCVVHVIDYFQANGTAYLVMEYLDGVALHAQMARMGGRIPAGEMMSRLAPLLRDIGQLHRRGVIHRDISPDNIMWMPDGGLKLLDFGSARSMESGRSMTVLMKQGFSPIEQYRSKGQGPYTDIYALAATIYYCVTGVIPPASMERLAEDTLQSPIALGAALTVQQETALLWALSVQPNGRPQSMEEFAAMLYKDGPAAAPAGPFPSGGSYTAPQGFPSRPVTGQNTGYPGSQGYAGQAQPQPVTGQNAGYPSSQGYIGQSTGPDRGQGRSGGGRGNKKLPVFIGAAVVIAVLVGVFVWIGGGMGRTAGRTTGVTDDGFRYEIVGKDHAVLTGYEGDSDIRTIPAYINDLPVTQIADSAFAGAPIDEYVVLPPELETIGANAFRNCGDLAFLLAYSSITTESNSFSGCDDLWFVYSTVESVSGWELPDGVPLYYSGMETGIGPLQDVYIPTGSVLVGLMDDGKTILLMDARSELSDIDITVCHWICPWALDNLRSSTRITLGPETIFPYELYGKVNWTAPEECSLSGMWLLSCETADAVNAARSDGPRMEPDKLLIRAAIARAEEFAELHDINTRPNGKGWSTVLDEKNVSRSWAIGAASYNFDDYSSIQSYASKYMAENFTPALTQNDSSYYAGQYYSRIGVGVARQSDGRYCWWGFVTIP